MSIRNTASRSPCSSLEAGSGTVAIEGRVADAAGAGAEAGLEDPQAGRNAARPVTTRAPA